jgi:2-haloacid dehalogenase/putative hydrolase of the HAD superfamily
MTRWEGVFLDFYGTLASGDLNAVESICQEVIDDHGPVNDPDNGEPMDKSGLARHWGTCYFAAIENAADGSFKLLREIERDTLIETLQPLIGRIEVDRYIDHLNDYCAQPPLFEEVNTVLEQLRLPICIVSNADERELRSAISHHSLNLPFVVSSESAKSYKPDPGIFETALELTGFSADRVLHIGDSLHSDIGGAHAAGIKAAWVNRAHRISDIGTERPDYEWPDLMPLLELQHE